jgi:hypothetical protein
MTTSNSSWLEDKYKLQDLEKQVNKLKTRQTIDHLYNEIVPDEAFLRPEDNTVDSHAKAKEISDIISKGYPNEFVNDKMLIRLYSDILREKDTERRERQRVAEMKERSETAEYLRKQFPTTFKDKHSTVVIN